VAVVEFEVPWHLQVHLAGQEDRLKREQDPFRLLGVVEVTKGMA